ncbi:hypothetical protein ACFQ0X_43740 [Streptomyces rectiviolaceus]|uniref:Transposase n=1 Tax=Streptomyces rectiviolaceus TaxID=332591 RepID=A0ABP6NP02_9ACTN
MKPLQKAKVFVFLTRHPALRRAYRTPAPTARQLAKDPNVHWTNTTFDHSPDYDAVQNLAACEAPTASAA